MWSDVIEELAGEPRTAQRLVAQLRACEVAALAFCRLLERWARGEPDPATPGERQSALRRAADRVETSLAGLGEPLERYLLELEADALEGRSWYGGPSAAELLDWEPVLIRALEGLSDAARVDLLPDPSSLWAGLFDLRDNLLGSTLDDLRVLAVA